MSPGNTCKTEYVRSHKENIRTCISLGNDVVELLQLRLLTGQRRLGIVDVALGVRQLQPQAVLLLLNLLSRTPNVMECPHVASSQCDVLPTGKVTAVLQHTFLGPAELRCKPAAIKAGVYHFISLRQHMAQAWTHCINPRH
jgi:hypothetical protein